MITVYAIHYSCLPDHVFIWACHKLVATQLLNQCQPFEPHEPHIIFVEYDMYLRLLYFLIIWIKVLDGYQIASL